MQRGINTHLTFFPRSYWFLENKEPYAVLERYFGKVKFCKVFVILETKCLFPGPCVCFTLSAL